MRGNARYRLGTVKYGLFFFVPPPDPALISDCALDRKSNTYNKSTSVVPLFIRQPTLRSQPCKVWPNTIVSILGFSPPQESGDLDPCRMPVLDRHRGSKQRQDTVRYGWVQPQLPGPRRVFADGEEVEELGDGKRRYCPPAALNRDLDGVWGRIASKPDNSARL